MFKKQQPVKAHIFEFTYDDAIILPSNRWAVDVNFKILGEGERAVRPQNIYTLVCSPQFRDAPTQEYKDYIDGRTLVMDHLDKEVVENGIRDTVNQLNRLDLASWEDYYNHLRSSYYVDD